MEESIRSCFGLPARDRRAYSPLTLAFLGDAVYELAVRTVIVEKGSRPPKELHRASSRLAKAETQSRMAELLQGELTEEELAVYRRGRNAHPATVARHATVGDYRRATGWEALMGYLYLGGQEERLLELIRKGWQALDSQRAGSPAAEGQKETAGSSEAGQRKRTGSAEAGQKETAGSSEAK